MAGCGGHGHGHEQGFHKSFDNADEWVAKFEGPDRDGWQKPDEVVGLMKIQPGMAVADLGAGTGYFLSRLSRAVGDTGRVLGVDVEADMVRFMKARAAKDGWKNVEARIVPTDDPGLEPASVDRILIVNTWHHIDSRGAYAGKLARALRPGGEVWVVDFTLEASHGPPAHARIPAQQLVEELGRGGLRAEIVTETLPDQYVVRALAGSASSQ